MKCQSCGRQSESTFCKDCANDAGELKRFDEIVESLIGYYVETQGFDTEVAKSVAIEILSRQPAWEKKIKKEERTRANFKKMSIVFMAIVVALTSGGIVYWLTSVKPAKSIVTYQNISSKSVSPFDNIIEKEVNGLQVFEIRCAGDQQIVDLSDSVLTFSSLEGSKYSKANTLFNIDISTMQGHPFEPYSIETRDMLEKTDFRVFNIVSKVGSSGSFWVFDPIKGGIKQIKEDLCLYNNFYYVYANYVEQSKYAFEISTGKVKKLPYFRNRYGTDYSFVDDESIIVPQRGGYGIINLRTGELKQTSIPDDFSIFGGTKKFKIVSKTFPDGSSSDNMLYVYNALANSLIKIDDDYSGSPVITNSGENSEIYIIYQKHDKKTDRLTTLYKNLFKPDKQPKVISTDQDNLYPVFASKSALVYTTKKNKAYGKWYNKPDDEKCLSDLWVRNLLTGQDYQLETGGVDKIIASESSVCWAKWLGSDEDQYFNVCFAKMPPQYINSESYDSEGLAPYDNIKESTIGDLDVSEMFCPGDQSFGKPGTDYVSLKRVRDGYGYDEKNTTSYFCPSSTEVAQLSQYDPGLPMPTSYLFDPESEKGVKLAKDNPATKRFLDDRKISIKWRDSDVIMAGDNAMFMYDHIKGNFETSDFAGIPKAMSLRKESSGNKTRIIFNDTAKDHEVMVIDSKIEKVYIHAPKDNSMVFTVKVSTSDYSYESRYFYLDTETAEATALGTNINILDTNSRYILIKPNVNDMASLKLFDRRTKKLVDINPNIKPVIGNLGLCKINNATEPDELVLAWPYPEGDNNSLSFSIAYARLSEISTSPKIVRIKKDEGSPNLIGCLGNWILYSISGKDRFETMSTRLYGYNISTGAYTLLHDNFSSSIVKVGDAIFSTASRGYKDKQFNNVVYIKAR